MVWYCPPLLFALPAIIENRVGCHVHSDCLPANQNVLLHHLHSTFLQHIFRPWIDPLPIWFPLWLVLLGYPACNANMETFEPRHCGLRNDPQFAAIEEDGLYYCLVEPGGSKRQDDLTPKNLPNAGPGGVSFLHLDADRLNIIVILGHEASQALEYFDPL